MEPIEVIIIAAIAGAAGEVAVKLVSNTTKIVGHGLKTIWRVVTE